MLESSTFSTGESYAFAYTPAHRLACVSGGNAAESFSYNPVGWLLTVSDTAGGQEFTTAYEHDEAGRVTSID